MQKVSTTPCLRCLPSLPDSTMVMNILSTGIKPYL